MVNSEVRPRFCTCNTDLILLSLAERFIPLNSLALCMVMEPVIDALKGFANHTQDLLSGLVHRDVDSSRRNPIEILKRLQRESFSDIMKLRDRQDKVERLLSFYNISNKNPLQEESTHVRGEVNVLGGVMKLDEVDDDQSHDFLRRAGIRTGIDARISFQTNLRKKDLLVAELFASHKTEEDLNGPLGCPPLSLAKVYYKADITETFSAIAIPVGAQCRDVGIGTSSFYQGRGLTDHSSSGPPLANQQHGSGIGITMEKFNNVVSFGHFVSGLAMQVGGHETGHLFTTFGQVICQLPRGIKLTLMGLREKKSFSNQPISLGPLAIPLSLPKRRRAPDVPEPDGLITLVRSPSAQCLSGRHIGPKGSIALALESDLNEHTKFGGWIQMKTSHMNIKTLQWACTVSDDHLGWGLSLSGSCEDFSGCNRFQIEPYLKFKLGKKFTVKPGLVHVTDGDRRFTVCLVRSYWSW